MRPMGDHPAVPTPTERREAELLAATHALRDREESERLRQLGGLLVHDLNNVLFALLGRVQLLERRAGDPATAKAAGEILATVRLLERQVVGLHAACRRDEPGVDGAAQSHLVPAHLAPTHIAPTHMAPPHGVLRTGARAAVERAVREAAALLPEAIRPEPAGLALAVAAIPADATFDGDAAQVATAVRQTLALHRARGGTRAITVAASVEGAAGDAPRVALTVADHAGATASAPAMPSLGDGAFDLAALPLAAAQRAIRDVGGRVACAASPDGLRTTVSFDVRRGVAVARFDAQGHATHAPASHSHHPHDHDTHDHDTCDHADECLPPARRVLVVDDDPAVRAVLIAALEAVGDDVDALDDPSSCDAHPDLDAFDVVVLDAGGGGLEALARLRARGVDVPVLVASGDIVERPGDARTRCVLKPIPLDALDRDLASLARLRTRDDARRD